MSSMSGATRATGRCGSCRSPGAWSGRRLPRAIEAAVQRAHDGHPEFLVTDGTTLPFADDAFDLVTSFQVIEHLGDPMPYLAELTRVVRPGGEIVLATPNAAIRLDPGMTPWNQFPSASSQATELQALLERAFTDVRVLGMFAAEPIYDTELARVDKARQRARRIAAAEARAAAPATHAGPSVRFRSGSLGRRPASLRTRLRTLIGRGTGGRPREAGSHLAPAPSAPRRPVETPPVDMTAFLAFTVDDVWYAGDDVDRRWTCWRSAEWTAPDGAATPADPFRTVRPPDRRARRAARRMVVQPLRQRCGPAAVRRRAPRTRGPWPKTRRCANSWMTTVSSASGGARISRHEKARRPWRDALPQRVRWSRMLSAAGVTPRAALARDVALDGGPGAWLEPRFEHGRGRAPVGRGQADDRSRPRRCRRCAPRSIAGRPGRAARVEGGAGRHGTGASRHPATRHAPRVRPGRAPASPGGGGATARARRGTRRHDARGRPAAPRWPGPSRPRRGPDGSPRAGPRPRRAAERVCERTAGQAGDGGRLERAGAVQGGRHSSRMVTRPRSMPSRLDGRQLSADPGPRRPLVECALRGAIAQLEEHLHGMQGVRGSSPRSSTMNRDSRPPTPRPAGGGCVVSEGPRDRVRPTPPTPDRTRIERYDPTAIEPRWQAHWAKLDLYETDLRDASQAQVLPADDVPVSVGRPAHRPLVHRHPVGRARALPADARLQRLLPDRLRCLRPARGERRHQERRPPVHLDDGQHREHAPPVPDDGRHVRLGRGGRHGRPGVLPLEPVAVPALPGARAWPIARKSPVDWCPNDGTLAREQVEGTERRCWRCGALVEKRDLEQWFLRTTAYADELLDFTGLDWPEPVKTMQTNWIGRSEGAEIDFETAPDDHQPGGDTLRVFTTRPDTLFGATFMVLAPEHPLVATLTHPERRAEVDAYVEQARRRTEIERLSTDRDKTGRRPRRRRHQPGQRRADPDLHRRLRAVRLRHRRDHGRARPRRARLRVRDEVRPGDPAGRGGARRRRGRADGRRLHRPRRGRAPRQQRPLRRPGRRRGRQGDRRRPGARPAAPNPRSPIGCATGWSAASATGARRSRSSTATRDGIVPVPDEDLPVRLPETVDYKGSGDNPLNHDEAFLRDDLPALRRPGPARDGHDGHVHGLVVVLVPLPVAGADGRPGRPRDDRSLDPRRPVHRRRRARGHAPAVQPLLHQGDGRLRPGPRPRAVQAAVQPGPDPGRRRRADEQVARQRPGPRRAGRALRRGHGPAVPDVHGPVGPGRAVEPDRDRRRPSLPEPRLDAGPRPARARAGRSGRRAPCRPARPRPTRPRPSGRPRTGPCATSPRTTRRSASTR